MTSGQGLETSGKLWEVEAGDRRVGWHHGEDAGSSDDGEIGGILPSNSAPKSKILEAKSEKEEEGKNKISQQKQRGNSCCQFLKLSFFSD